jgi:hypothetical protein
MGKFSRVHRRFSTLAKLRFIPASGIAAAYSFFGEVSFFCFRESYQPNIKNNLLHNSLKVFSKSMRVPLVNFLDLVKNHTFADSKFV